MSKISNNIGFDALLVFVQHQILSAKYLSVTFLQQFNLVDVFYPKHNERVVKLPTVYC